MRSAQFHIEIDRPREEVFRAVTDVARLPDWQPSVTEAAAEGTDGPHVGMRGHERRRTPMGVQSIRWEVTDCEPDALWAVRGTDGPVRARTRIELSDGGRGATRLDYSIGFEGHGPGRLLAPLALRGAREEVPESLTLLKRGIEGSWGSPDSPPD